VTVGCRPQPTQKSGALAIDRAAADPVVLHVFHVTKSESDEEEGAVGAGFPYARRRVITAAHGLHGLKGPIKVDGQIMRVEEAYRARIQVNPPDEQDWVVLTAPDARFAPDRFAPRDWMPRAGQRVRVGGFQHQHWLPRVQFPGNPEDYERAFNAAAPVYVEGVILDRALFNEAIPDQLFWIKVPKGDYRGFSGGPAAILEEKSGEPLIVGAMVAFGELEFESTGEAIWGLEIVRVPPPSD
jgi:hypothetical protein